MAPRQSDALLHVNIIPKGRKILAAEMAFDSQPNLSLALRISRLRLVVDGLA